MAIIYTSCLNREITCFVTGIYNVVNLIQLRVTQGTKPGKIFNSVKEL